MALNFKVSKGHHHLKGAPSSQVLYRDMAHFENQLCDHMRRYIDGRLQVEGKMNCPIANSMSTVT